MFDTYKPAQAQKCPVCCNLLTEWQGKDGPCALFVWEESVAWPVSQEASDMNIAEERRIQVRLPEKFEIYSYDCGCPYPVNAICQTERGTWSSTKVIDASLAMQRNEERKGDFKKRLKWLEWKRT